MTVIVRQWGPNCYAAYVAGSGRYPEFVGTAESRDLAQELAESCCAPRVSDVSEQVFLEEWAEKSDGPRLSIPSARLAPDTAGAAP